jgi:hypothetical protein
MATIGLSQFYRGQDQQPVLKTQITAESISSSGVSAASTGVGVADGYWFITPLGNVWMKRGTTPTAVAGEGPLLAAGQTYYFEVETVGEKCAFIDAS